MIDKLKDLTKTKSFHICMIMVIIVAILFIVGMLVLRYNVEGETNMPFELSKIAIISSQEGIDDGQTDTRWSFNVHQANDIYLYIDKNENYWGEEKTLKSVTIENINITKAPTKGEIKTYMPNSVEGRLFSYKDEYIVNDKLEFKGAEESNPQTLEIGSNGGSLLLSFSNTGLGTYSSNKDDEITHDGTLLEKIDVTNEEIGFEVSFDIVITVDNCSYRGNMNLQLPCGNILEEGTCSIEETDFNDVIFKRE